METVILLRKAQSRMSAASTRADAQHPSACREAWGNDVEKQAEEVSSAPAERGGAQQERTAGVRGENDMYAARGSQRF